MSDKPVVYLIDASSYIHRAFHAIRNLSTSDGQPTGAVYGFLTMMLKVMDEARPDYLVIAFDSKGPTFRHGIFPDYKANRPPADPDLVSQFPLINELVTAMSLPASAADNFEADDLIASLARQAVEAGFEAVIVSGDKDLYQLVGPAVTMWDTARDVRYGPTEVEDKIGLPPEMAIDFQALTGDSSDNVPGVPGIGPKTATKLLKEHPGLEEVLAAAPEMKKSKVRQNLIDFAEQARLSKTLVTLSTDAPVDFNPEACRVVDPDPEMLLPLLNRLEFSSLAARFTPKPEEVEAEYRLINDLTELKKAVAQAKKSGRAAIDTETDSIDPIRAALVGFSICHEPGRACYVPLAHTLALGESQLDPDQALPVLAELTADRAVEKVGQNIKYDLIVLKRHGVELAGPIFDTMVADYLLDPGARGHGLAALAANHLGRGVISYEEATGGKNLSFAEAPLDRAVDYAAEDADVALQLADAMVPKLAEAELTGLMNDLEAPLIPVIARIEMNGVRLDLEGLREQSKELQIRLVELERECYHHAGRKFNLNSPKQLGEILFEELELPQVKKTKKTKSYSTDVAVLTVLADQHPLPKAILEYRTLTKLKSTYIDALPALINPETGRIHTSFNQAVTATGRLSSSDPNLQNIPIRTELGGRIRACFVPDPGMVMVSADYSQVELRVLAHLSDDPLLLGDLNQGLDVHTQTASRLYDVAPEEVSREMRARAKTVNFGLLYGMGAHRLAREQEVSYAEAQEIIDKYLGRYTGIAKYREAMVETARQSGYVTTILGRRRYLPDINSANRVARQAAERIALNTPIQGSAADLIKLAMLKVDDLVAREFPAVKIILQVHDELVFEVPQSDLILFQDRVKEVMETVYDLKTPLKVDLGAGSNWADAH